MNGLPYILMQKYQNILKVEEFQSRNLFNNRSKASKIQSVAIWNVRDKNTNNFLLKICFIGKYVYLCEYFQSENVF